MTGQKMVLVYWLYQSPVTNCHACRHQKMSGFEILYFVHPCTKTRDFELHYIHNATQTKEFFMDTFTTHITFFTGVTVKEDPITSDKLSSTIIRLVQGPAAQMNIIKEVRIVDQMDCTVFLARDNKVVFPTPKSSK